jgi:hypothetical protein
MLKSHNIYNKVTKTRKSISVLGGPTSLIIKRLVSGNKHQQNNNHLHVAVPSN